MLFAELGKNVPKYCCSKKFSFEYKATPPLKSSVENRTHLQEEKS